jgi:hypothetical protein
LTTPPSLIYYVEVMKLIFSPFIIAVTAGIITLSVLADITEPIYKYAKGIKD